MIDELVLRAEEECSDIFREIDNNEYYEGYHIEERRWNGWATPKFEKHVADLIAHNFSSTDFNIKYNFMCNTSICDTSTSRWRTNRR